MAKKADRVRNWPKYNEALVNRGSITFWFEDETLKNWYEDKVKGKRGRPKKYSDMAIICGLTLKAVFKLTFRAVEGFVKSLIKGLKRGFEVPDYTLLCKRQKNLLISLPKQKLKPNEKIQIVVDTTGIKVFGEGEWKVRQYGYMKHRLWRKLHLAINSTSQEIEACELTCLGVQDCEGLAMLLEKMDRLPDTTIGDGTFDRFSCYELSEQFDFKLITPPQRNAVTSKERICNRKKASLNAVKKRDEAIDRIRELGRKEWKVEEGYHRRSLAETAIFRIKTLLGNKLSSRKMENQKTEINIWCRAMNKMTSLGLGR